VALDKDQCLQCLATLKRSKDVLEQRAQGLGLNRIEYLTHGGIAGHPFDAVNPLQIVLGSLWSKASKEGDFRENMAKAQT
jgi:hypothetical protein